MGPTRHHERDAAAVVEVLTAVRTVELRGRAWSGLRFVRRSPTTFRDGPIYQAGRPAIGSPHTPFSPLYLPAGWHAPVGFERTA